MIGLASALLFVVATLTDALDGYLARRWGVESLLGRIMDPFADKLLVLGALIFMAGPDFWWRFPGEHVARFSGHGLQISGIYPWMVVVVVARELLVTSMRGVLEAQGVKFGASWSGKLKMIFQSVAIPAILGLVALTPVLPTFDAGTGPGVRPWGRDAIDVTAWSMVGVTILSDMVYRPWSLEGQRLELRSLHDDIPSMDVGLAWARGRALAPPAAVFRAFMSVAMGGGG